MLLQTTVKLFVITVAILSAIFAGAAYADPPDVQRLRGELNAASANRRTAETFSTEMAARVRRAEQALERVRGEHSRDDWVRQAEQQFARAQRQFAAARAVEASRRQTEMAARRALVEALEAAERAATRPQSRSLPAYPRGETGANLPAAQPPACPPSRTAWSLPPPRVNLPPYLPPTAEHSPPAPAAQPPTLPAAPVVPPPQTSETAPMTDLPDDIAARSRPPVPGEQPTPVGQPTTVLPRAGLFSRISAWTRARLNGLFGRGGGPRGPGGIGGSGILSGVMRSLGAFGFVLQVIQFAREHEARENAARQLSDASLDRPCGEGQLVVLQGELLYRTKHFQSDSDRLGGNSGVIATSARRPKAHSAAAALNDQITSGGSAPVPQQTNSSTPESTTAPANNNGRSGSQLFGRSAMVFTRCPGDPKDQWQVVSSIQLAGDTEKTNDIGSAMFIGKVRLREGQPAILEVKEINAELTKQNIHHPELRGSAQFRAGSAGSSQETQLTLRHGRLTTPSDGAVKTDVPFRPIRMSC